MADQHPGDLTFYQKLRWYIYNHFAEQTHPPTIEQAASDFGITPEQARDAYQFLHRKHAIFLEPGTHAIRMANPMSAVPTAYQVHAAGRSWWANCAWDALGIPAMLHSDATIVAECAHSHAHIELAVEGDWVIGGSEIAHFALPFRRWYDDLIHT